MALIIRHWGTLRWALGLLAMAALCAAYARHFDNGFYFDDYHTIVNNASIRSLSHWPSFFTDISTFGTMPTNRGWRPMVTLCNAIDVQLGGGKVAPLWFHIHIFLDYLLLLVLLFVAMRNMLRTIVQPIEAEMAAFAIALVYGFHTANAETVNYVIARSDGYCTLWMVVALVVYQHERLRKWQLHLLPVSLALMTKESGVVIVPILGLYHLYFIEGIGLMDIVNKRSWAQAKRAFLSVIPAAMVASLLTYISVVVMRDRALPIAPPEYSAWQYFHSQWVVVAHYLGNFVLPLHLSVDPYFEVTESILTREKLMSLLLIVALHLLALFFSSGDKRQWLPISFGILWFFIALAPTSTLKPLAQVANDHRTFMPYIGLALASVWSIHLLLVRLRTAAPPVQRAGQMLMLFSCLAYTVMHGSGIMERCEVWGSEEELWHDAVVKGPENGRANLNYGVTLMARSKYVETLPYFEKALEKLPTWPYTHINMAILKGALGKEDEAAYHYNKALEYGPVDPEMHLYNARWHLSKGRADAAIRLVDRGLIHSPRHAGLLQMREALSKTLLPNDMVARLRQQCQQQPTPENWINLSLALYQVQDYQGCVDAAFEALKLRPDYDLAYNNICSGYIMLNEMDKAIEACENAIRVHPNWERAENNLRYARSKKK